MGMGLGWAGANAAMAGGIRQRLIDQLQQQHAEQQMGLAEREMKLRESEAGIRAQEHKATLAERAQVAKETAATKNFGNVGIGNAVDQPTFARTYADTPTESNFTPERTLAATQVGGGMALPAGGAGSPDVAAGQTGTQAPNVQDATVQQAPMRITGRMISMGTEPQRQAEQKKQYLRGIMGDPNLSERERLALRYKDATGDNPPAGVFDPKPRGPGQIHDTPNGLVRIGDDGTITPLGVKGYHQPVQAAADKLVKVEHRDEATGKTITEWLPQSELRGKKFAKGASGALESRLASAESVNQTGDDIIAQLSDPKVSAALGPAMGRVNTLRELMGDPPPELSRLAGAIESYSIATMGVHGMRSTAGSEKINKMLDRKHTPESLAETIRGLSAFSNHFMENEGRRTGSGGGGGKKIVYDMDGNPVK